MNIQAPHSPRRSWYGPRLPRQLDRFDRNWTAEFRAQFSSPPADWLQQDQSGKALASWYGGDYRPACMNNPDWRVYEKAIVREQLESGCDGIFFDNPTVHPQGCYCPYCMEKFGKFLKKGGRVSRVENRDSRLGQRSRMTPD